MYSYLCYEVLDLEIKYNGKLAIKNKTAPTAMSPGKNKYMASRKPIASPTCSTSTPRDPRIIKYTRLYL